MKHLPLSGSDSYHVMVVDGSPNHARHSHGAYAVVIDAVDPVVHPDVGNRTFPDAVGTG